MGSFRKKTSESLEEDPAVELARQHAEYRKAQLRLHKQKKKEAKLKDEQRRLMEEAATQKEESKAAVEEAVSKVKDLKRLKTKFKNKLQAATQELQELQVGAWVVAWSAMRFGWVVM